MCPDNDNKHLNKSCKYSRYRRTLYAKSRKSKLSIYKKIIKHYINNNRCYTSDHWFYAFAHLPQTSRINLCKCKRNKTDKHYMKIIKSQIKRLSRIYPAVTAVQIQTYHFVSCKNKSSKSTERNNRCYPDFQSEYILIPLFIALPEILCPIYSGT